MSMSVHCDHVIGACSTSQSWLSHDPCLCLGGFVAQVILPRSPCNSNLSNLLTVSTCSHGWRRGGCFGGGQRKWNVQSRFCWWRCSSSSFPIHRRPTKDARNYGWHGPKGQLCWRWSPEQARCADIEVPHRAWHCHQLGWHGDLHSEDMNSFEYFWMVLKAFDIVWFHPGVCKMSSTCFECDGMLWWWDDGIPKSRLFG